MIRDLVFDASGQVIAYRCRVEWFGRPGATNGATKHFCGPHLFNAARTLATPAPRPQNQPAVMALPERKKMNILTILSREQQAEIRANLFASEEFFNGLTIGLARAGVISPSRASQVVENIVNPKITLELARVRELANFAKQALPLLAKLSTVAVFGTVVETSGLKIDANSIHNALRDAIAKVEKLLS